MSNKLISLIADDNLHITVQADGGVYLVQEKNDVRDTQQIINLTKTDLICMLTILKLNGIEGVTL